MSEAATRTRGPVDFSRSAVSRYIQLATLFRRRIESGLWALEQQIPTVDDLAAECGVARATIRQALGVLEGERLIERFRAKGTFVIRRPHAELWCEVGTDWSGLLTATPGATIEILSDRMGASPDGLLHSIGEAAPSYRHLRRRHWRNEAPYLVADVFIDESLSDRIPESAYRTKSALRLVHDIPDLTIVDARQTLTVGTADLEVAELLRTSINAPIAIVERFAVDAQGRRVFAGKGIYRGDIVRIDIKLK